MEVTAHRLFSQSRPVASLALRSASRWHPSHGIRRSSSLTGFRRTVPFGSLGKHRSSSPGTTLLFRCLTDVARVSSVKQNGLFLDVSWNDKNEVTRYPFIYLRDCCLCPDCVHPESQQRQYDYVARKTAVDIEPRSVEHSNDGKTLTLTWPDGHKSVFDHIWLNDHQLKTGYQHLSDTNYKPPPAELWTAGRFQSILPNLRFPAQAVLSDQATSYNFLHSFNKYGFAVLTDCGQDEGVLKTIGSHIGYLKETAYGNIFKIDCLQGDTTDISLLTGQHYVDFRPGVVLLRPLTQSSGSACLQVADGFAVASKLREENSDFFRLLSTVKLNWSTQGRDSTTDVHYFMQSKHPVIRLNIEGEVQEVTFGTPSRDTRLEIPPDQVHDFYRAYKRFGQLCRSEVFSTSYMFQGGDVLMLNVWRLIHGQITADSSSSLATIEGGFIDSGNVNAKLRDLHPRINKEK